MDKREQDLISALKQRDPTALAALFEQYADKIYRLAAGILNDEQQADGVVQDTFLKLIEHINHFEGRSSIGTWLYRVAYNECQQRIRQTKPQVDVDSIEAEDTVMPSCLVDWKGVPESLLSSSEAMQEMEKAVSKLSSSLRAVFAVFCI